MIDVARKILFHDKLRFAITVSGVAFAVTLGFAAPAGPRSPTFLLGVALALLVIVRHRDNFRRLARGEERRFSWKGGKGA